MKGKIVPVRGMVARLAGPKVPNLKHSYMMRLSDYEYDYMIPRPDGSIVVGGGRRDFYKNLNEWFDVADDSSLIAGGQNYYDDYMQRHFYGWEDSNTRVEDLWTGSKYPVADVLDMRRRKVSFANVNLNSYGILER